MTIASRFETILAGIGIAGALGNPFPARAQTADDIVARVLAARGGAQRVHGVHALRMSGHISFGDQGGGALAVEQRSPNQIRGQITFQDGRVLVRAYDGAVGWTIDPLATPAGFRRLAGDELKNLIAEGDFEPLVDAAATGDRIAYVGRDTVAGAPAYKLSVTQRGSGYRDYYYVDSASGLPVKWQGARPVQRDTAVFESYFRDYAPVHGVRFPRVIETGARGSTQRQQISFDKIEVNPSLDRSRFAVPVDTVGAR